MIKTIISWGGAALVVLSSSLLASCSDKDDNGEENPPVPSVTVAVGEATATTLQFTLTLKDADKGAYLTLEKSASAPTAAEILSQGKSVAASGAITVDGLSPDTDYRLYALASKGNVHGTVVSADNRTLARPAVTLTAGTVTETSLTFNATLAGAERAAYLCIEKTADAVVPTADAILRDGTAITASAEIPVDGLNPSTVYLIVAAASKGSTLSDVAQIEMTTDGPQRFTQQALGGYYGKPTGSSYGEYRIVLADAEAVEVDGVYSTVGAGMAMSMDLFQMIPSNLEDIKFPDRNYRYATTKSLSTFHPDGTFCMVRDGSGNLTKIEFKAGTIAVTKSGTTYTFTIDLTTTDDQPFEATYVGPVAIADKSSQEAEKLPDLETDVTEINFIRALAKYYKNTDEVDNCIVHLYDVEPGGLNYGSDYLIGEGHMVSLDLSTPRSAEMQIADGVYNASQTQAPGVYLPGYQTSFMDTILAMGTYCEKRDASSLSVYGFVNSGTATITKVGDKYRFTLDLVTDKGHKVTGSFEGTVEFTDKRES